MKRDIVRKGISIFVAILVITTIGNNAPRIQAQEVSSQALSKFATKDIKDYTNNQIIVSMKEGRSFNLNNKEYEIETLVDDTYLLTLSSTKQLDEILTELEACEEVSHVQPNYHYQVLDYVKYEEIPNEIEEDTEDFITQAHLPNDPYFSKQWGLYNMGGEVFDGITSVAGIDIGLMDLWDSYTGTKEVIVAVMDTGIDINHEDLKDAIWVNQGEIPDNGVDDDGNGYIDDVNGWDFYNHDNSLCSYNKDGRKNKVDDDDHGTHCAGVIAATADNNLGIAGVASKANVKIMPLKILGGRDGTTSTDIAVKSIQYAMNMGVDIISASWGAVDEFEEDVTLLNAIKNSGILFVAAAGNEGKNNDMIKTIPACYSYLDNVISVASIDCDGFLSDFSNYGSSVNIVAPGNMIASTIVGSYAYMSGTSMAAPMVTGVAAMIYATQDYLYPSTVKNLLLSSFQELTTLDTDKILDTGLINVTQCYENQEMLEPDSKAPNISGIKKGANGLLQFNISDPSNVSKNIYASGICTFLIARGKKNVEYFANGTVGVTISNKRFRTKYSGYYTIYARDYAGNEVVKTVISDKLPPSISTKVTQRKITITVTDKWADVAKVRYASGNRSVEYFEDGLVGTKITLKNNSASFTVKKAGTYTIYAVDLVGNETVKKINIK